MPLSGSPSFARPDEVPLPPIYAAFADPSFLVDCRFDNVEYSLPEIHQIECSSPIFWGTDIVMQRYF